MFQFGLEKLIKLFIVPIAVLGFIGVGYYAYQLEMALPPADEKVTPFQHSVMPDKVGGVVSLDDVITPLEKPHRTNNQIQEFLSMVISEALTFEGRDYDQVLRNVRPYFTKSGFDQYTAYLDSIKMKDTLIKSNYRAGIFFDQNPYVGKGQAFQGAYRWQANMPIVLSFSAKASDQIVNRKLNVGLQLRRIKSAGDPNEMRIESWQAKARRG